jgi:hypothetical protein
MRLPSACIPLAADGLGNGKQPLAEVHNCRVEHRREFGMDMTVTPKASRRKIGQIGRPCRRDGPHSLKRVRGPHRFKPEPVGDTDDRRLRHGDVAGYSTPHGFPPPWRRECSEFPETLTEQLQGGFDMAALMLVQQRIFWGHQTPPWDQNL